jgi:anti-anti-sigma factor
VRPEVFAVESSEDGSSVAVALFGELDLGTVDVLRAELDRLTADGRALELIIDLRELEFLDSTGLHLLLRLNSECRERGGSLGLIRGCPAVQKLFEVTGTDAHFNFVELEPSDLTDS